MTGKDKGMKLKFKPKVKLVREQNANLSTELFFQSHLTALKVCNQVLQMSSDLQKRGKYFKNTLNMFGLQLLYFNSKDTLI